MQSLYHRLGNQLVYTLNPQLPVHTAYQLIPNKYNGQRLQSISRSMGYCPPPPLAVITGRAPRNQPFITVHRQLPKTKVIPILSAVVEHTQQPLNTWIYTGKSNRELGPYKGNVIRITRSLLDILSGGNTVGLLSSVLSEREQLKLSVVKPMVAAVKDFVNDESNGSERQKAMQFLSPFITFDILQSHGFNANTRGIHCHSKKKYLDGNKLRFHYDGAKGRPSLINNPEIQSLVIDHCIENADFMHEDILKRKTKKSKKMGGDVIHAKRLRFHKHKIWNMFPHKTRIKRSSFFNLLKKHGEFKNPKKWTDLCEFCEDAKQSKKVINKLIRKYNEYQNDIDGEIEKIMDLHTVTDSILNDIKHSVIGSNVLNDHEQKLFIYKLNDLSLYIAHRKEYTESKDEYRKDIKHTNPQRCVFTADYKQKIPIGHKLRETSHIFRNLQLQNCLGVHLQFANEKYVFHAITNVTNQTSLLSRCILSYILDHPAVVSKFKAENIVITDHWYDSGSHFYNNSLLHFHFFEIPHHSKYQLNDIGVHFFPGKHGKNDCDSTFNYVTHAVDKQNDTEHGTQCSQDIVDALNKAERERQKEAKQPTTYCAVNFDIDGPLRNTKYMKPLQMDIPMEKEMITPQFLSFRNYYYRRDEQRHDVMTGRKVQDGEETFTLSLPSMKTKKLKDIDKVFIKTKYLPSSKTLHRRHGWKLKKATPLKIGKGVKHPEISRDEMRRQMKRRTELEEKYGGDDSNVLCIDVEEGNDIDVVVNDIADEESYGLNYTVQSLKRMNYTQLKVLCREHELHRTGKKGVLLKRLMDQLAAVKARNAVSG